MPYPPDKGERLRAFHEIRALSEHFRITLAALAHDRADCEAAAPLGRWCEKVILAPAGGKLGLLRGAAALLTGRSVTEGFFRSRRLRKLLEDESAARPFGLVFAYCSSMLPLALTVPAPARVMDLVDVDSAKWAGYAEGAAWPKRWLYRREARAVAELERKAVAQFDAVVLVSQAEARVLDEKADNLFAVANGVDTEYFAPAEKPRVTGPSLVFTGTMDYRPNVEGVCWFVREVWPAVKRDVPELTFSIVGRDPAPAVRRLAKAPGVTVTGAVPDVRPYLAAASVSVCPLQIARGIQNKILEAMAAGKPVVASPAALEGLDLAAGKDVLQAETPEQWRRCIGRLLADESLAERLGRSARACVMRKYDWAGQMQPLVSLCRKLVAGREPGKPGGPGIHDTRRAEPGTGAAGALEGARQ